MEKVKKQNMEMEMEIDEKVDQTEESNLIYRGWKVMPFIIGNEVFEKLGIIGTLSNFLIYLTSVFNMESITAATIINIFAGTTSFGTLIAAFLCDTYFGRYKTLGFATIACFMGAVVILLTAAVPQLHPPHCSAQVGSICAGPTGEQFAFLLAGLGLLIVGAGGIRPCNLAFGADQFNPHTESGKRGINSFFNWYFFTYTFAQIVSLTLIVYVQSNVSWTIGLTIPAVLMLISTVVYFSGSKLFIKVKATGSPLLGVAKVIVVSFKKKKLKPVEQPWVALYNHIPPKFTNSQLAYTHQLRFLDKAAIMTAEDHIKPDGSPIDPWKLCTMQQVEEVKCIVRVLPIWFAASIYYTTIIQQVTYGVFQALQSDRRLGGHSFEIPAASYVVFLMLSMTIFIAVYDKILVPFLKRITGKENGITVLQRMGTGLFISIICMLVSAFVEEHRRKVVFTKPTVGVAARRGAISSMPGLWLIPQLMLGGIAEAFIAVGQMEFYYKQFPENMRSFAGALYCCGSGISSYLSSFLITFIHRTTKNAATGNWLSQDLNKGRLDYYYYMIAALMALNFAYFLVCSNWFKYKVSQNNTSKVLDGEANHSHKTPV